MSDTVSSKPALLHLPDGRRLAYAQYGAADGRPVLLFHGLPGSRLQRPPDIDDAAALDIRLIAMDRPGIGCSDPLSARTLNDWPADVAALADALDLARFAVVGVSGGAPYAAACARALPERIEATALVSGLAPLDGPQAGNGLALHHRALLAMARRLPGVLAAAVRIGGQLARHGPSVYLALMGGALPAVDKRILIRKDVRTMLAADLAEAFRQGTAGVCRELAIAVQPWGFAPDEIRGPVKLWHGEADSVVPIGLARGWAAAIPGCGVRYLAGAGHFFVLERWREILEDLLAVAARHRMTTRR